MALPAPAPNLTISAEEVAEAAVARLDKGGSVVIPGMANRVSASLAQVTPRSLLVPILAKGHPGLH